MPLKRVRPTELELTILRVLWAQGPSSVRQIYTILNAEKETGYTTVLKMLQIMTDKGLVRRDESVRPQVYRPASPQAEMQQQLLHDLVQRAYGGSVRTLIMQALGSSKSSPQDLATIEKLLERAEGRKK